MPSIIGPVAGRECKLYYQTALATTFTVSGAVLVTEAKDVNLSNTKNVGTVGSRVSGYQTTVPGLKTLELTFGYQYRSDPDDTILTAIRQAYEADTVLHWAVMDNIISSPGVKGSQGMTFPGMVTEFPIDQPLEDGVTLSIKVQPVRAYSSGTLINPAWLTIAAT